MAPGGGCFSRARTAVHPLIAIGIITASVATADLATAFELRPSVTSPLLTAQPGPGLPASYIALRADNSILPQGRETRTWWGNIDLAAKLRLVERSRLTGFRLNIALTTPLPTASAASLASEGRPSARPRLVAGFEHGRLCGAITAGYNVRRRSDLSGEVLGGEATAGAALALQLLPRRLWIQGEAYAAGELHRHASAEKPVPVEVILGVRAPLAYGWTLQAGVGSALAGSSADGFDPRGLRALATVAYQPWRVSSAHPSRLSDRRPVNSTASPP